MPNLIVSIPHRLSRIEARRRIQDQVGVLHQQGAVLMDLKETWTDDTMDFTASVMGQSISGQLSIDDHVVHVEVTLPWILAMVSSTVKHRIERQVNQLLAIPGSAQVNSSP